MSSAPLVSVVIPARDAAATLPDTLAALGAQELEAPFEVVVVDDDSSDATGRIAAGSTVVDRVVPASGLGPARARNTGAHVAAGQLLAFIDADCKPTPGWLAAGCAALDDADLVLGETRPRPDQPRGPLDRTLEVVGCSPLFEAANLFVRRELYERLDGFESWLRPRVGKELGEDVWFGWRARRAGARVTSRREALAYHAVEPRGPVAYAAERWRLRFFPALVARIPELRTEFLYRRWFLNPRSARFDAALIGLLWAVRGRRPVALMATLPYARLLANDLVGPGGVQSALAKTAADAVGLAAMLTGSVRYGALLA
jgi:glycosyltransferase involved in cell wall biosynthesis